MPDERNSALFSAQAGLVGTDWDLVSTLGLLVLGNFAGFVVWQQGKGGSV